MSPSSCASTGSAELDQQHASASAPRGQQSQPPPFLISPPNPFSVDRLLRDGHGTSAPSPLNVRRLLDRRGWSQSRLLVEVVVLAMATSGALAASASLRVIAPNRWLAAMLPLSVLTIMHA